MDNANRQSPSEAVARRRLLMAVVASLDLGVIAFVTRSCATFGELTSLDVVRMSCDAWLAQRNGLAASEYDIWHLGICLGRFRIFDKFDVMLFFI